MDFFSDVDAISQRHNSNKSVATNNSAGDAIKRKWKTYLESG